MRPLIEHGASHVLDSLKLNSQIQLSSKERKAIMKKIRNNTYFGQPEAVILACLGKFFEVLQKRHKIWVYLLSVKLRELDCKGISYGFRDFLTTVLLQLTPTDTCGRRG